MKIKAFTASKTFAAGSIIDMGTTYQGATVARGITVAAEDGKGIVGIAGGYTVNLQGDVVASSTGLQLGATNSTAAQKLTVGVFGSVLSVFGDGAQIAGSNSQIKLAGPGFIQGGKNGLVVGGAANGTTKITNGGTILGEDAAGIARTNSAATIEKLVLVNTGWIEGGLFSFHAGASNAVEQITNNAYMTGKIFLGLGDDTLINNYVIAGDIDAGGGNDKITFQAGTVVGNVTGGAGNDTFKIVAQVSGTVDGGIGNDTLYASAFSDTLKGGTGIDQFRFTIGGGAVDHVQDYSSVDDTLYLDLADYLIPYVGTGALSSGEFLFVPAGQAGTMLAGHRVIYFQQTGTLHFDADGSGGSATIDLNIQLDNKAGINAADIVIV